jgi:hypothetical protein
VVLALAPAGLPAAAQHGGLDNVKDKLDAHKRIAEELLKRSGDIIALIKGADEKAVEAHFNQAMSLIEQVIKSYDEGSPLTKALDEADGIIRRSLEEAKQKASSAPALWQPEVDGWRQSQANAVRQRTELKKLLQGARGDLETMKQNKDLLMSRIRRAGIKAAQDLIDRSLKDFASLSQNMKDMIATPSKALPGGGT